MIFRSLLAAAALLFAVPSAHAAFDFGDLICESSTTTGTGTVDLAGALTNYVGFASQITSGSVVPYHIIASDGKLEVGYGVFTDAGTDNLTRVANWSTDGSGAELTLPAGTHSVCVGPNTQMFNGFKGMQFYNDDAGAVGGILPFWHDSTSSADGDISADIQVYAGADDEEVARIALEVDDGATTTEDTRWRFFNDVAGASVQTMVTSGLGAIIGAGTTLPGNDGDLRLYSADDAAVGPKLQLHHDDPSADAADDAGTVEVYGGADDEEIGSIVLDILDPATTTEDTEWIFTNRVAGSDLASLTLGGTDANFGFGHQFSFGSAAGELSLQSSVDGTVGAGIITYHNDPSADTGDFIGFWDFYGEDSAGNSQQYGGMGVRISDATSTGEDSSMYFDVFNGGSTATALTLAATPTFADGSGGVFVAANGSLGLDNNFLLAIYEAEANGDEFKGFISAAANTASTTCTFENDANFIPDSCVGDGSDASDARLKDVIGPAGDVGAMIDGIKIYNYKWNTDAPDESEDIRKGKHGFGPIAQELFNLNADFVDVGGDNPLTDPWTWKPEKVVPYLIVDAQKTHKRLDALEAKINPTCYGVKLGSACIGVSM
jgi:hypothetical protein